ncbi:MAG: phosphatase PAP2 family protein [Actinomycetota bacterium]|nr:phosphatase PAP2 family protein [Actinomycetota bacterium]
MTRWWNSRVGYRLGIEVALMGSLLAMYRVVRLFSNDELGAAFRNARRVISIEQVFGMFTEAHLQQLALTNEWLIWLLNHYYFAMHFSVTTVVMVVLYLWRPANYRQARLVMIGTTTGGLLLHLVFPLAPPRMLPGHGFVDTLARFGPKIYDSEELASAANQIAAMPSLHVGWALIVCWAVVTSFRTPWRWVAVAHPTLTILAVVLTANHYWLDGLVAAALVTGFVHLTSRWAAASAGDPAPPSRARELAAA